jgi:hypothetical protein
MKRALFLVLLVSLIETSFAADVDVVASGSAASGTSRGMRSIAFTSSSTGYAFYIDNGAAFKYKKTTDAGATWGTAVTIHAGSINAFDVWFDQWTPADSGTLIHTWYFGTTNNSVFWRSLDTSSDTLGTQRTAFTGVSVVAGRGTFVSGTKTRSGYLYAAFDLDAGAEKGIVRSTDSGTTWSANLDATNFIEATIDQCKLFPATGTGDNNDCWAIYQDASADALTMKMWDSSAAAQVESASVQGMAENVTDGTGQMGFDGAIRKSDGHLIIVSCSAFDTAQEDMQVWDVSGVSAGSLTGITAKTDITTNTDDIYNPAVLVDSFDNIYVAYNGARTGGETLTSATKVYYTKSVNGGTSWTAGDTAYMQGTAGAVAQVWTSNSGSRFFAMWRVGTTLTGNSVNSVELTSAVKTVMGLAKASVKTVSDLAIASVKTIMELQ